MSKTILKCIVLFTLILSMMVSVLSFTSCNRSYDEDEVLSSCKSLLQKAAMLNEIYYGNGIQYLTTSSYQNGAYYEADPLHLATLGFTTVSELKTLTEKTFTVSYSLQIYSTVLSPLTVDGVNLGLTRYYQKYEDDTEISPPVCIMVYSNYNVLFKDSIVYDYSSMRVSGVKKDIVTVTIDANVTTADGKSQDIEIDVQLLEESDGWRINNHTWANYNDVLDEYNKLEQEELK